MSLAEELLADLDDMGENDDVEEEEEDIVDINDQLKLASEDRSIHAITRLSNSQEVLLYSM